MLENITLDSILRDHYFSIHSEKLSENNITINEELEISNSSEKYVIRLAKFLNESYYKGYVISSSILSKLMDIIEYTGYEYQVLESYIDILNNSMNKHLEEMECKPDLDKLELNYQNCINFVTNYSEIIKDIPETDTMINNYKVPHFSEPNVKEQEFNLYILKEVSDPIQFIYDNIKTANYDFNKIVESLYLIYKNKPEEFLYTVQGFNSEVLFFLLNEDNYDAIDICVNNINSLNDLMKYIKAYYIYMRITYEPLSKIMVENVRKIFTIITINLTDNQLAMIISEDYLFWKQLNKEIESEKLFNALSLYEEYPKLYKVQGPIDIIHNLNNYHINDRYYIARYVLLNMDYRILCDNFVKIAIDFYNCFTIGESYELIGECIDGLMKLNIDVVKDALIKLSNSLKEDTIPDDIHPICSYTIDTISSYLE